MPETTKSKLRTYKREIPVILTNREVELYGRQLASKKRERDTLTEKAKQTAQGFKGQVGELSSEIDRLAVAIDSGKELRAVAVYDELDGSQVFTKRVDTDELVDQRPAGFHDKQADMFETDEPDPALPAGEEFQPPNPPPAAEKPAQKKRAKKPTKKG